MEVAHPQSGYSSTLFLIELESGNVGFWGEGKARVPGEKLSKQRREPTTNSTHIWHQHQDLNPGHIGGEQALSPQHHPLLRWIALSSFWTTGAWFPGRKVGVDSCHLKRVRSAQSHLGVWIEDFGIPWEVWYHCLRFKKKKESIQWQPCYCNL